MAEATFCLFEAAKQDQKQNISPSTGCSTVKFIHLCRISVNFGIATFCKREREREWIARRRALHKPRNDAISPSVPLYYSEHDYFISDSRLSPMIINMC